MVQVGMNERTKKKPAKPENVLEKSVFIEIKTKSDFNNRQTKGTTQKSGTATTELVNLK
jgi:hypothetical protein